MKRKLLALLVLILLTATGACGKTASLNSPGSQTATPAPVGTEAPQTQGKTVETPKKPALEGALLVMIDNYYQARPQMGLDKADLVYEVMAEGGITRYMALYYKESAEKIGPVRSARYYFAQLARGYDAPLAHAGGSQEALNLIAQLKLKDMDEIYNAGGYFWRDRNRKMPHNLYTSTERLITGSKNKGYSLVPPPQIPTATTWEGADVAKELNLDYSSGKYTYKILWRYNGKYYERFLNEKPYALEDGTAIKADNILVMVAESKDVIKNKILLSEIKLIGKGEIRYFIEGKELKGTWEKESAQVSMKFLDDKGQLMKLKEGKTWVQVIPTWSSLLTK